MPKSNYARDMGREWVKSDDFYDRGGKTRR